MSYEKMISRADPGLIVMLLDDSASMADDLPGTSDPKYKWVERYCGIILNDLLERSSDVKGNDVVVKPRYYIHVIKYGSTPELWGSQEMDIQSAVEMFSQCGNSLGLGGSLGGTQLAASYAEYVHLKDYRKIPDESTPWGWTVEGTVLGEGDVDLAACVAALREAGYDGFVALEYEGADDEITGVPRSVEVMNRLTRTD